MEEMYQLIWNEMYLVGFSDDGSSVWGVSERQSVWMLKERAEKVAQAIKLLDNLDVEVVGVN